MTLRRQEILQVWTGSFSIKPCLNVLFTENVERWLPSVYYSVSQLAQWTKCSLTLGLRANEGWSGRLNSRKLKKIKAGWGCIRKYNNPVNSDWSFSLVAHRCFVHRHFALHSESSSSWWVVSIFTTVHVMGREDTTSECCVPLPYEVQCTVCDKTVFF